MSEQMIVVKRPGETTSLKIGDVCPTADPDTRALAKWLPDGRLAVGAELKGRELWFVSRKPADGDDPVTLDELLSQLRVVVAEVNRNGVEST